MKNVITYVGIDAHKKDLFVAMLTEHEKTPVAWTVPNEPNAVKRLVRKLEREAAGPVRCCYEAGPCGYALQRRMTFHSCCALSKIWPTTKSCRTRLRPQKKYCGAIFSAV